MGSRITQGQKSNMPKVGRTRGAGSDGGMTVKTRDVGTGAGSPSKKARQ